MAHFTLFGGLLGPSLAALDPAALLGIAAALVVGAVFLVDRGTNKLNRVA